MIDVKIDPFEKVLFRESGAPYKTIWEPAFRYQVNVEQYINCHIIPYEGNENLLGTTKDYTKTKGDRDGEFVKITDVHGREYLAILERLGKGLHYHVMYDMRTEKLTYYSVFPTVPPISFTAATKGERLVVLCALRESGKRWDEEKKKIFGIEPKREQWTPSEGETYYTISYELERFEAIKTEWTGLECEIRWNKKGLVFKNKENCQELADKLNASFEEALNE